MSFFRAKLRATDRNVYLDNRLTNFTNPPVYNGNLYVSGDETVGGNLDVSGNLTVKSDLNVYGNLRATSFYATGNYYLNNYILIPYGTVIQSAAVVIPGGWLVCDGSSCATSDYPNLFAAIGYTYGGSGAYFNLPDLRGRTAIGSGTGAGLTTRHLADKGGEESHMLTTSEMPAHSHSSNASGTTGNYGLIYNSGHNTMNSSVNDGNEPDLYQPVGGLIINSAGGGSAHNNMQPYVVLQYLIKY